MGLSTERVHVGLIGRGCVSRRDVGLATIVRLVESKESSRTTVNCGLGISTPSVYTVKTPEHRDKFKGAWDTAGCSLTPIVAPVDQRRTAEEIEE